MVVIKQENTASGPGGSWCHLMGRQLWLADEYEVVESANSPTREQRRGVCVSGMVSILGLRVAGLTVNITYHKITGASQVLLPLQRSPSATLGDGKGWRRVSSSYTLLIRPGP